MIVLKVYIYNKYIMILYTCIVAKEIIILYILFFIQFSNLVHKILKSIYFIF
jgi:hypothetical protein